MVLIRPCMGEKKTKIEKIEKIEEKNLVKIRRAHLGVFAATEKQLKHETHGRPRVDLGRNGQKDLSRKRKRRKKSCQKDLAGKKNQYTES